MRKGTSCTMLAMVLLAGCSSYVGDYQYSPRPGLSEIHSAATTQAAAKSPAASGLATIVGIRKADKDLNLPLSVEVRLRLDNNEAGKLHFDPQSIELSSGSLMPFAQPIIRPNQPMDIPRGQSASFEAHFPFPPGRSDNNTDLSSLQLRWRVEVNGQPVRQDIFFRQVYTPSYYYYYDPYYPYYSYYPWYPYPGYGWYARPGAPRRHR